MPAASDNTDAPERNQWAVYWAPGPVDNFGNKTWLAPDQVACRWSEEVVEFSDVMGNKQVSKAVVYPDRDLTVGGFLWQGRLADVTDFVDPTLNGGSSVIQSWRKIPTSDADEFLRKAFV